MLELEKFIIKEPKLGGYKKFCKFYKKIKKLEGKIQYFSVKSIEKKFKMYRPQFYKFIHYIMKHNQVSFKTYKGRGGHIQLMIWKEANNPWAN